MCRATAMRRVEAQQDHSAPTLCIACRALPHDRGFHAQFVPRRVAQKVHFCTRGAYLHRTPRRYRRSWSHCMKLITANILRFGFERLAVSGLQSLGSYLATVIFAGER